MILLEILAGAALGGLFVLLVGWRSGARGRWYGVGLSVAALIYVAFAIFGGGELDAIALEVLGLLVFSLMAAMGLFLSPLWLGIGWALHALWDWPVHHFLAATYVPAGYPEVCIGFDLVLAAFLLGSHIRSPRPPA